MPRWFDECIAEHRSAGLILVPNKALVREVIEDLLLIWLLTDPEEWVNRMEWLPL